MTTAPPPMAAPTAAGKSPHLSSLDARLASLSGVWPDTEAPVPAGPLPGLDFELPPALEAA